MFVRLPADPVFTFSGPRSTLKIDIGSGMVTPPGKKDPIQVYFPVAKAANISVYTGEDSFETKEPFDDTNLQIGAPHPTWAVISSRLYHGFEVPDYLLTNSEVKAILDCLAKAPRVKVSTEPFPPPPPPPSFEPYPTPQRLAPGEPTPF